MVEVIRRVTHLNFIVKEAVLVSSEDYYKGCLVSVTNELLVFDPEELNNVYHPDPTKIIYTNFTFYSNRCYLEQQLEAVEWELKRSRELIEIVVRAAKRMNVKCTA